MLDAGSPFAIVAVTVTEPAAVVESVLPVMPAPVVPAFFTLQAMVLFVALVGATVPLSVRPVPAVAVVGTPVMPVTGTKAAFTVSVKLWVASGSAPLAAVMVMG